MCSRPSQSCPQCGDGIRWALPVAAGGTGVLAIGSAAVVQSLLTWVVVLLVLACAAGTAWLMAVLRADGPLWRPAAQVKAPPRVALERRTAPRAIEAPRRVIDGVVIRDEISERR